jgi:hypothetical protein
MSNMSDPVSDPDPDRQVLDLIRVRQNYTDQRPYMKKTGSGSTPKSGSISHRYESGSGSGSFYHQAKIVRATLKPTVLRLL